MRNATPIGAPGKQTESRKLFTTLKRALRFRRPVDDPADVLALLLYSVPRLLVHTKVFKAIFPSH